MTVYLSIDIGGTYIKYAFINDGHELFGHQKIKTNENVDNAIRKQVEEIIDSASDVFTIKGVGISTAGIVDRERGKIIYAGPTIQDYAGTDFKSQLSRKFGLPIHVENDVNAALLGERWKGAAQGEDHVFCITLGTGIGGAYFHQQLVDGFHHQANSVGYLLYDEKTNTNYESRAATSALNRVIEQEVGKGIEAKEVFDRAKSGDKKCMAIIHSWASEVAKGLAQIIILIDPKCILIGGGISRQGEFLLKLVQEHVVQFLPKNFLITELKIAELFNDAALYGAVYPFFKEEL
ncbi:ROK family protein [Virgibacillus oceani]|uniref:Glucokinase n=1 Tax=Virgibacillus oceani TaxID=1479511 RepID=A0A917HPT9_9BACI|nr:ROK family protein [Virgibacillus oceani]GGG85841.1 glucokinase [Virgibacillus oceani]